jgi:poly-gamma-glutamate capsule biosynthesis protein CapA/YwtB (metallophosphatase superfamily)
MKKKNIIVLVILIIILIFSIYKSVFIVKSKNKVITTTTNKKIEATTKKQTNKIVNVSVVGDFLFENPFYNAVNNGYDYNNYFTLVKDYFKKDDLSIGNMEVVIGSDKMDTTSGEFNFCAPEYVGKLVSSLDLQVLSTANNHANDRGLEGINSSIDFFKNNTNILTVGTYKSLEERNQNHILTINNVKIGFLAYTYRTNKNVNSSYQDLISFYRDPNSTNISEESKNKIKEDVERLKGNADAIIVIMHWGTEYTFTPNDEQKEMANYLNSLGVDIIVGSHPHTMQPIEIIGNEHKTLVFYSLGNFVSADTDIGRTVNDETFDNSYQIGLLGTFTLILDQNNNLTFDNIHTKPIINYFDKNVTNFKLIPFEEYTSDYETSHYRYSYGLTKEFIQNTFNNIIDKKYQ